MVSSLKRINQTLSVSFTEDIIHNQGLYAGGDHSKQPLTAYIFPLIFRKLHNSSGKLINAAIIAYRRYY